MIHNLKKHLGLETFEEPEVDNTESVEEEPIDTSAVETEENSVPTPFEHLTTDESEDNTLMVVDVAQDIESLEAFVDSFKDQKRVSKQTQKVTMLTLANLRSNYGIKTLGLEEFPPPVITERDKVETIPAETLTKEVNGVLNKLRNIKVTRINETLNEIEQFLTVSDVALKSLTKELDSGVLNTATKFTLTKEPKSKSFILPVRNYRLAERRIEEGLLNANLGVVEERLTLIEHALEYIFADLDSTPVAERAKELAIGFEHHQEVRKSNDRKIEFTVREPNVVLDQINDLKLVINNLNKTIENIKGIILRIRNGLVNLDLDKHNIKIINTVILSLKNDCYFKQPLITFKERIQDLDTLANILRLEIRQYFPDYVELSNSLESIDSEELKNNPFYQLDLLGRNLEAKYLNPEYLEARQVVNETIEVVSIKDLANTYESSIRTVLKNIKNSNSNQDYYKEIKDELLKAAGSIDVDNVVESIRKNLKGLMDKEPLVLPELHSNELPTLEIVETQLDGLDVEQLKVVAVRTHELIDMVRELPKEHFGVDFYNTLVLVQPDGKIVPKLDTEALASGLEGDDLAVVTQYVELINKDVYKLIDQFNKHHDGLLVYSTTLATALTDWMESQVR